jgi:outer membrane protein
MRLTIAIVTILLPLCLGAQQSFSLEEAVNFALQKNSSIRLKQLEVSDARSQIKEFRAIGMPKVQGSVEYQHFIDIPVSLAPADAFAFPPDLNRFLGDVADVTNVDLPASGGGDELQELQFGLKNSLSASVTANALLFDGSFFVGLRAAKLYKELVAREMVQTSTEVKLSVTKAYLAVLIAQKNKEIIDKNIANLAQSLQETRAIYENGFAEKLDVDRLQLSLSNLETEADKLERLVQISLNLLKFQMGYPMEESLAVTDDIDQLMAENTLDARIMEAEIDPSSRPEYSVLQTAEALNELNIKRNKVGYLPSLYAFGSYQQIFQANDIADGKWFPTTVVGATLNVPIFDGLDKESKIERARIDLEEVQLQKTEFMRSVQLEVQNARSTYLNALETTERTRENRQLAEEIYSTTQIKYREGVGSSVEVSQAERELYTAQANYINALYDLLVAKVDLDKALGNL